MKFIGSMDKENQRIAKMTFSSVYPLYLAKVEKKGESIRMILEKGVRGIASGQSAVFYSMEGECVGGGVIV